MISADGMVLGVIRVDTRVALEERRLFAMRRRVNNAECAGIHFNVHYTRMQRDTMAAAALCWMRRATTGTATEKLIPGVESAKLK
jgi:hypothetical protein